MFPAAFDYRAPSSLAEAVDILEAAAWTRAKADSDTLLIFLLKAHRPAMYRERVNLHHSGAVKLGGVDLSKLSDEELEELERLAQRAGEVGEIPGSGGDPGGASAA